MHKAFIFLLLLSMASACEKVDPLEEALSRKITEVNGVWIWVNTQYPTPFGVLTVTSLKNEVVFKVLITGEKAEVFRQDKLVQKFSFEIRKTGEEFYLDILGKEIIEYSAIDMLGGKISINDKDLTLSVDSRTFKSDMLLSRVEIFN